MESLKLVMISVTMFVAREASFTPRQLLPASLPGIMSACFNNKQVMVAVKARLFTAG